MVTNMFLENNNFSVNILSVHELSWDKRNDISDLRPFHALSFRTHGKANFYSNNNTVSVQSGDIIFVPKYCQYRLESEKEHLYVVHFNTDIEIGNKIKKYVPENPKYFEHKFSELYATWIKKQLGYNYECKSILFKILAQIEREDKQKRLLGKNNDFFDTVEYIHEHFTDKNISVGYLAKLANMSETYYRKLFFQYLKVSPKDFINNLRLQYALELLSSGYYTVSEIAEKCGFENIYYFSTFIKNKTGASPSCLQNKNSK